MLQSLAILPAHSAALLQTLFAPLSKMGLAKMGLALGLMFAAANPVFAQENISAEDAPVSGVKSLNQLDKRLARIAEPILQANGQYCRQNMPLTGMVLHSRDQYGDDAALDFAGSDIGIAAIVPNSPAANAGLLAGDALIALNDVDLPALGQDGSNVQEVSGPLRDVAFEMLADTPPADPLNLTIMRDGVTRDIELRPQEGCRALVEILAEDGLKALSDGRVIQVSYGFARIVDDEQLAVIFAHELAHLVLEHRRRLLAAGISKGALGEFGKNQRLNRQVEVEADRLSAHLLANAGYDPAIASRFWLTEMGRRADGGMMRSWTYPSPTARSQIIAQEIARYLPLGTGPSVPAHLLSRRDREF